MRKDFNGMWTYGRKDYRRIQKDGLKKTICLKSKPPSNNPFIGSKNYYFRFVYWKLSISYEKPSLNDDLNF